MDSITRFAMDIAKEVVVAKMGNSTVRANKESSCDVADFYEEIYNRILSIANHAN